MSYAAKAVSAVMLTGPQTPRLRPRP